MPALPPPIARRLQRWYWALAAAFGAGCVVALAFRLVVDGRSWESMPKGIAFLASLSGMVLGVMLAYGGRAPLSTVDRDARGERRRGRGLAGYPPRPVAGLAQAAFWLPLFVVTLTM